ncbi:hypothetical protein [Thalassospira mesophila]|uniref:Polysaccharide biosynthesis protein n=1 Tax=Thalassospira mesophila TaxID=1293891 RepID=A0A1Y2L3F9_9PROT|nr:hypothetical protein [Thalassospira mesophila]OSQ39754.1 hypothetical protein TMES_07325 [Thalassospira mesophila]
MDNRAPLWMIGATALNRAGGLIMILILGHAIAPDILAGYFSAIVTIGVAISITQAGCGPLLVRLAQNRQWRAVIGIVMLRVALALAAILILAPGLPPVAWPVLMMPLAAALSPDWIITARLQFHRILAIGSLGQIAGIAIALYASAGPATNSTAWLYACAPAISLTTCLASAFWAWSGRYKTRHSPAKTTPRIPPLNIKIWPQLILLTLLAGLLPNIDIAFLPSTLAQSDHDALMLVHRLLLLCAAGFAAISGVLFAQKQTGAGRDIWLFIPALCMALALLILPNAALTLLFGHSSAASSDILRLAAPWPLLLALVLRQILILQERSGHVVLATLAMVICVGGAAALAQLGTVDGIVMAMNAKLALLAGLFMMAARLDVWQRYASCQN